MAAESHERFRLGYPDDVVDRTLAFARRPVTHALEVGAGTGKATRAFASRGIAITAVEPDEDKHAVLERETAGMAVIAVRCTIEAYDGPPTGLVYAAGSFPWSGAPTGWSHAAHLLEDHGVLALFESRIRIKDPDLEAAITRVLGDRDGAARTADDAPAQDRARHHEEMEASGLFADARHHRVERQLTLTQQEYVGHVTTQSTFLRLPWPRRQLVLAQAFSVLPQQVVVDASVDLDLARRA